MRLHTILHKPLAILLVLVLILGLLPSAALATDSEDTQPPATSEATVPTETTQSTEPPETSEQTQPTETSAPTEGTEPKDTSNPTEKQENAGDLYVAAVGKLNKKKLVALAKAYMETPNDETAAAFEQAYAVLDAPETGLLAMYEALSDEAKSEESVVSAKASVDATLSELVAILYPVSAIDLDYGDFTLTKTDDGSQPDAADYSYADKILHIKSATPLTISGTTTADRIVVDSGVAANLTLSNLGITAENGSPIDLGSAGATTITLAEDSKNTLIASTTGYPGILVPNGKLLTIKAGGKGTGSLSVTGGLDAPGIGRSGNGKIKIDSGIITADTFKGANIEADTDSENGAAAIGGAKGSNGGELTISGGTVTARGYQAGGIGAGQGDKTTAVITITGGSVHAASAHANPIVGTLQNGSQKSLLLAVVTLDGVVTETPITATNLTGYGLSSVQTDKTGKLFFYLPKNTVVSSVTADETLYNHPSITVGEAGGIGTLYPVPKTTFSFDGTNAGKLMGTTTRMKYSVDGGTTWKACTAVSTDLNEETISETKDILVKDPGDTVTTSDSQYQTIDITKGTTPTAESTACAVAEDNDGKLTGVTDKMEYQKSGDTGWTAITGTTVTDLSCGTYYVRAAATGTVLASEKQTLAIASHAAEAKDKPQTTFSFSGTNANKLQATTASMNYSVDGGTTWIACTATSTVLTTATIAAISDTNDIKVKDLGDGVTTLDSPVQTIDIAKWSAPSGVSKTNCTTSANNTGKITGLKTTMQWKKGDGAWKDCTTTSLTGLSNATYYVRYPASGTHLASEPVTLTIAAYTAPSSSSSSSSTSTTTSSLQAAPEIRVDFAKAQLTGFQSGSYYKVNNVKVTPDEKGKLDIPANWYGTKLTIVKCSSTGGTLSKAKSITIPVPADAPTKPVGIAAASNGLGSITGVDYTMEYRAEGSEKWFSVTGSKVTDLEPGSYEVRVAATIATPPSGTLKITIDDFDPVAYSITVGKTGSYTKGSEQTYEIRVDAPFDKFDNLTIDNTLVSTRNYDVADGSTIITFHANYLGSLFEGSHTVAINFLDGNAEASLEILAGAATESTEQTVPAATESGTSRGHGLPVWVVLLIIVGVLSAGAVVVLILLKKKKPTYWE